MSFVIPAHNEENYLRECILSVIKETQKAPYPVEIIVVNNASTDRTKETAISCGNVTVIDEPRKSAALARERGFEASRGDLIAYIDADTILPEGWLGTVEKNFSHDPRLVALSGPCIYYDLPLLDRILVKLFYIPAYVVYLVNHALKIGSIAQLGNLVVRRWALEKIGGYSTHIAFYGDEADLVSRLVKVGEVRFTFSLPICTSGRRLAAEGILRTGLRYTINYFWVLIFGEPFTKQATDIRPMKKQ